jgi:hypothetical protein
VSLILPDAWEFFFLTTNKLNRWRNECDSPLLVCHTIPFGTCTSLASMISNTWRCVFWSTFFFFYSFPNYTRRNLLMLTKLSTGNGKRTNRSGEGGRR